MQPVRKIRVLVRNENGARAMLYAEGAFAWLPYGRDERIGENIVEIEEIELLFADGRVRKWLVGRNT
jgi:hypothetical protein